MHKHTYLHTIVGKVTQTCIYLYKHRLHTHWLLGHYLRSLVFLLGSDLVFWVQSEAMEGWTPVKDGICSPTTSPLTAAEESVGLPHMDASSFRPIIDLRTL